MILKLSYNYRTILYWSKCNINSRLIFLNSHYVLQVPHPSFLHLLAVKCNPFSQSNWYPILKMHKKIERERKPFKMIITIKCYGSVYVNIVKLHCFISYEWIMNRSKISCKILKSFFDLINHCILCNLSDIERYTFFGWTL